MNDWYNTNEHRSYPFIENLSDTLPKKEIVDCRFFLKNALSNKVYLSSRDDTGSDIVYIFHSTVGDFTFTVPKTPEYKVIWVTEDFGYGFCVFGNTETEEE